MTLPPRGLFEGRPSICCTATTTYCEQQKGVHANVQVHCGANLKFPAVDWSGNLMRRVAGWMGSTTLLLL